MMDMQDIEMESTTCVNRELSSRDAAIIMEKNTDLDHFEKKTHFLKVIITS